MLRLARVCDKLPRPPAGRTARRICPSVSAQRRRRGAWLRLRKTHVARRMLSHAGASGNESGPTQFVSAGRRNGIGYSSAAKCIPARRTMSGAAEQCPQKRARMQASAHQRLVQAPCMLAEACCSSCCPPQRNLRCASRAVCLANADTSVLRSSRHSKARQRGDMCASARVKACSVVRA